MKICDKCKRQALITHNNEHLCVKHYNLLPDDKEDKPESKKEVSINDYILL